MKGLKILMFGVFLLMSQIGKAIDSLQINLMQADSIFLANNYYLLASSMNIEDKKAQILQAKLYPNPLFSADFNAYRPSDNKYFQIGNTGQKAFQIQQLILIGGKRKAEIEIAKSNQIIAELEFQRLIRELKFKLHSDLFQISQQKKLLDRYNFQLNILDTILGNYEIQVQKGNIPLKDLVRLRGVYLNLNSNRSELLKQFFEAQTELQVLLQTNKDINFIFSENNFPKYIKEISVDSLITNALLNRSEYLILQESKNEGSINLRLQKRLAIPDINLFSSFDQNAGAFHNQINAGVSIALPFWNRNQGNIKSANFQLKEIDFQLKSFEIQVVSEVSNGFNFYSEAVRQYKKVENLKNKDLEMTMKGMTDNFQKRNVSVLEFVDFFESYNGAEEEITRIKIQLLSSAEKLNLIIGKDIY